MISKRHLTWPQSSRSQCTTSCFGVRWTISPAEVQGELSGMDPWRVRPLLSSLTGTWSAAGPLLKSCRLVHTANLKMPQIMNLTVYARFMCICTHAHF